MCLLLHLVDPTHIVLSLLFFLANSFTLLPFQHPDSFQTKKKINEITSSKLDSVIIIYLSKHGVDQQCITFKLVRNAKPCPVSEPLLLGPHYLF